MSSNSSNLRTQFLPQIPFLLQTPHPPPHPHPTPFLSIFITVLKEQQTRNTMFLYTITVFFPFSLFTGLCGFVLVRVFTENFLTTIHSLSLLHSLPPTPSNPPIVSVFSILSLLPLLFFFLTLFVFVLLFYLFLPHASFLLLFPLFYLLPPYPFLGFVYLLQRLVLFVI